MREACASAMATPTVWGRNPEPDPKIATISHYKDPAFKEPTFNRAAHIVAIEINGPETDDNLNESYANFENGEPSPSGGPGLVVEFFTEKARFVHVISKKSDYNPAVFRRSDGSITDR